MFQGELVAIYIATKKGDNLSAVDAAEAIPSQGLAGDRYFSLVPNSGTPEEVGREVTLIESEALEAIRHEDNMVLDPSQSRRNLLTRGVPLNHLVGRDFQVGDVVLRGIRLCEPCGHLEKMTVEGIRKALCHRGGLRARIVRGGQLRPGAVIRPVQSSRA
jgi:MOSC domain-containing protein YiiM